MKVHIKPSVDITVQADPSLLFYMFAAWLLSALAFGIGLTLAGLRDHAIFSQVFNFLSLTLIAEFLISVVILQKIRKRMEKDADEIVRDLKKMLKEADN